MKNYILLLLLIVMACASCGQIQSDNRQDVLPKKKFVKEVVEVEVIDAEVGSFTSEVHSNGKVYAANSVDIRFPFNEKIVAVSVNNGDYVKKGQSIARLDATNLQNRLARSKEAVNKALLELDDRLIDYGYRLRDTTKVPASIMLMSKVKSGFNSANYEYIEAQRAIASANIKAPFSGRISNVEARPHSNSADFQKVCTLINDDQMFVEFMVLETEYNLFSKGSPLIITPYSSKKMKGMVITINPVIDGNGMIKIRGSVPNSDRSLIDGMSVKVIAERSMQSLLYIPKEAVVQRDNREVVFTFEKGLAKWNYVVTGMQNSKYVVIKSGLSEGQKVIIKNNLNLAHDSEVTLSGDFK